MTDDQVAKAYSDEDLRRVAGMSGLVALSQRATEMLRVRPSHRQAIEAEVQALHKPGGDSKTASGKTTFPQLYRDAVKRYVAKHGEYDPDAGV